jgi:hypothetical protein
MPPIAPQSPSSIIWGLYNRPEVAAVPRDLVPPHQLKKSEGLNGDILLGRHVVYIDRYGGRVNTTYYTINQLYIYFSFFTICFILIGHYQASYTFIVHLILVTTYWPMFRIVICVSIIITVSLKLSLRPLLTHKLQP